MKRKKSASRMLTVLLPGVLLVVTVAFAVTAFSRINAREVEKAESKSAAQQKQTSVSTLDGRIVFTDVEEQSRTFMEYHHSIDLTEQQEAIKAAALGPMPAACCADSSALTCCCPCNLSKTIWGLSNYLITEHGANADEVRIAVYDWMSFTNPNGYRGDSCYTGGCEGSFDTDGCGGMKESNLVL